MTKEITVHKRDETGHEVWRYQGVVLEESATFVKLEARFNREDIEVHGLLLRRGDRFIEYFYTDRWYNIFTIYDVDDDTLKGWYCNITRPARIQDGHVYADDLALDLIVRPDGRMMVLDEEEFADLQLSLDERQRALESLDLLKSLAKAQKGPFRSGSR